MGATTATVVTTVLGCGVVALIAVLWAVARRAAVERTRRERLEHELGVARAEVAALGRRLEDLGHEVVEARTAAERAADRAVARTVEREPRAEREFVITSLGETDPVPVAAAAGSKRVGALLEETLVRVAGRHSGPSSAAATRLAVGVAALGHGVRRALSPDVLDRAAAEATVARRRSRRDRKRELREARRVLRTVQERPSGKHVA